MEDGRFGAIAAIIRQVELTMISKYGSIFLPPEAEPASDRVDIETGGFQATTVPVTPATTLVDPLLRIAETVRGIASLPGFLVREKLRRGSLVEVLSGRMSERGVLRLL